MTEVTQIPKYYFNNNTVEYRGTTQTNQAARTPDKKIQAAVDSFMLRRSRSEREESGKDKLQAALGATVGTILPMLIMMKKQGIKNPMKLTYDLKEMVILSASAIMGSVCLSMIGNDSKSNLNKSKEGIFQFMNAAIPTWLSAAVLKWCESTKGLNNSFSKIIATTGAILIGLQGSAAVSNIICDPKDKYPDRKLGFLDSLASIDDLIGVLVLAKIPFVQKLHIDKILPAIYAFCGYRAGKSN